MNEVRRIITINQFSTKEVSAMNTKYAVDVLKL